MPTTPLPEAKASLSTSRPSTSRTRSIERWAGQIQAQALSVRLLPMSLRLWPTSCSRATGSISGKHLARLIRTTSRERLGSFHISQPMAEPTRCTAPHGSMANNRKAPTSKAPLNFSTGFSHSEIRLCGSGLARDADATVYQVHRANPHREQARSHIRFCNWPVF